MKKVKTERESWHYHRWLIDDERAVRVCSSCGEKQIKVSGKWRRTP